MDWRAQAIRELSDGPCCGYRRGANPASEPTALAALALCAEGLFKPAREAARWLVGRQAADGSVGVRPGSPSPGWPTSLAVLVWKNLDGTPGDDRTFVDPLTAACNWILNTESKPLPAAGAIEHNTRLVAWPWVSGTHAWVEPSALCVLALKACGHTDHPRTREGVRMLFDRQLPQGGCNYGNTRVTGRTLLPHLQPSGLALLALAGETNLGRRVEGSIRYLRGALSASTPAVSLSWSLLGLAAHGRWPSEGATWLALAAERNKGRDPSPLKTALLLLADRAERAPLFGPARAAAATVLTARNA